MSQDDCIPACQQFQSKSGHVAIISHDDNDLVASIRWRRNSRGYFIGHDPKSNSKTISLHRTILQRMIGRPLTHSEEVDHINGDKSDNRRSNLRLATHAQNQQNRPSTRKNQSGLKGAYPTPYSNRWRSFITSNGKRIHLGYFDTPEEAHQAYCEAAIQLHGEFANFEVMK